MRPRRPFVRPLLVPALLVLLGAGCEEVSLTTSTQSSSFTSQKEKMAFVKRYLKEQHGLLDAEYAIIYQDNGQGMVPGPSDWNITVALKVDTTAMVHWTPATGRLDSLPSLAPWSGLGLDSAIWRTTSKPMVYQEVGMQKVIYPREGIVLAHYSTYPLQW